MCVFCLFMWHVDAAKERLMFARVKFFPKLQKSDKQKCLELKNV